jgi:hypothetical protein
MVCRHIARKGYDINKNKINWHTLILYNNRPELSIKVNKLFIDDVRPSPNENWILVRSSAEAIGWLKTHGCPSEISFDHDLGGDDTAMRVVHWMIETDMDMDGTFIPPRFRFNVHSANPVGRENIKGLLEGYLRHRWLNE